MKRFITTSLSVVTLSAGALFYGGSVATVTLTGTAAAAPVVTAAQQTQNVTIQNMMFSPASMTVSQGTTVVWTNKDSTAHTVTSDSGTTLNSNHINPGQTYSHTFDQAGTYAYHCSIHPQMKATITVTASNQNQGGTGGGTTNTTNQSSGSNNTQQQTTTPTPGTGGGGTTTTPSQSGSVATGPVAAGSGSVAMASHRTELVAALVGITGLVAGTALLILRRFLLA